MKKKLFIATLVAIATLSFASCGHTETSDSSSTMLTTEQVEVEASINENGVVHYQLSIVDPDLTKLPTAGGNGTLPFTCAGIITMLVGIAILKKKRHTTE